MASSWRNTIYPRVLQTLRDAGHDCYDFRNPSPGNSGFAWSRIDPEWKGWDMETYRQILLSNPIAWAGYQADKTGMDWAEGCVLVMPSGRSAHLEAGWMMGRGKPTVVLLSQEGFEPDLMYLLGAGAVGRRVLATREDELLETLEHVFGKPGCN